MRTLKRKEAIQIIASFEVKKLLVKERESLLLDWWSIDEEDEEFHALSNLVQQRILDNDMPLAPYDECYDQLLEIAISAKYTGVSNLYLKRLIYKYSSEKVEILDAPEPLLPCPCCEYKTLTVRGAYEICPVCFWEDDGNEDLERYSGCNRLTLGEAKMNFDEIGAYNEDSIIFVTSNPSEKYLK